MTLLEVILALTIITLVIGGVLASFVQARRLTMASIAQNCALAVVQGYVEQIKNLPLQSFVNASPTDVMNSPHLTSSFTLPTLKDPSDQSGANQLKTTPSTVSASSMLTTTPGTTPDNVVDNLQTFSMGTASTETTTWDKIWPGANTTIRSYPSTTPGVNDLRMNFWVQITDLTSSTSAKYKAYGVLIVYTWQYLDGSKITYNMGSVRTIRSAVQTF